MATGLKMAETGLKMAETGLKMAEKVKQAAKKASTEEEKQNYIVRNSARAMTRRWYDGQTGTAAQQKAARIAIPLAPGMLNSCDECGILLKDRWAPFCKPCAIQVKELDQNLERERDEEIAPKQKKRKHHASAATVASSSSLMSSTAVNQPATKSSAQVNKRDGNKRLQMSSTSSDSSKKEKDEKTPTRSLDSLKEETRTNLRNHFDRYKPIVVKLSHPTGKFSGGAGSLPLFERLKEKLVQVKDHQKNEGFIGNIDQILSKIDDTFILILSENRQHNSVTWGVTYGEVFEAPLLGFFTVEETNTNSFYKILYFQSFQKGCGRLMADHIKNKLGPKYVVDSPRKESLGFWDKMLPKWKQNRLKYDGIASERGADTEGADTEGADTEGADTEGADTEGADTEGADTEGADTEEKDPQAVIDKKCTAIDAGVKILVEGLVSLDQKVDRLTNFLSRFEQSLK
jgi:hypothetical protein